MKNEYNVIYGEYRAFDTIIANDANYRNNIYFYDGVGCGSRLPLYFENKTELAKSLGTLRTAFVDNNPHLPPPSYF